jgi:hypothetical protein
VKDALTNIGLLDKKVALTNIGELDNEDVDFDEIYDDSMKQC